MVSPVRMDRVHPLRKMEPRFTYCRGFEVGLEWNWRESSSCNLLIDKRLSVDYTLLRSSISKKRRSSCDIRAPLLRCIVCSHDDAVLVAVVCSSRIGVPAIARNCARASCTRWCGDTRGLCAQQWFGWAMNVPGYRSSGAALCCARIHQRWWAQRLPIVVTYALVVAEPCTWPGARRSGKV